MRFFYVALACSVTTIGGVGCRTAAKPTVVTAPAAALQPAVLAPPAGAEQATFKTVAFEDGEDAEGDEIERVDALDQPEEIAPPERLPPPEKAAPPSISALTTSVRNHFPLIQQALASRVIASGEVIAAQGAFDHKLEGYSNSQPLDFYKNYWHGLGLKRDTYGGGEVFAGYRVGRGAYEPWYLERETNKGGEFKAGFVVPLSRDRTIDENRAELWRSELERGRVEPEIRAMIIGATRDATATYWEWVAAGAIYDVTEEVLQLGLDRTTYLDRQVKLGEKADIELVDNQRIILSRSAKVTDARRKLQQSAIKLSLFLRDNSGVPIVVPIETSTFDFPDAEPAEAWGDAADLVLAQSLRPELAELNLAQQQLTVLLRQAQNEMLPQVDAGLLVAQDVGEPTSSKRDKSEFELEAAMTLSVPIERRKAIGKARQLRGKIAQLRAKTQFAADKIALEAQIAHAALVAAATRVDQTTEGLTLARRMAEAEGRLYELGQSTLFNLNLREQQAAEAAVERVAALFDYHVALADYAAALGMESVEQLRPPGNRAVEGEPS